MVSSNMDDTLITTYIIVYIISVAAFVWSTLVISRINTNVVKRRAERLERKRERIMRIPIHDEHGEYDEEPW